MIFRICTEQKANLSTIVCNFFDCFSIVRGVGYWRGVGEQSAMIEVAPLVENLTPEALEAFRAKVNLLAVAIARINSQEAVLVQEVQAVSRLVWQVPPNGRENVVTPEGGK